VLKDELAGKKTSLAEQRALAGTQQKKEILRTLEEGAGDSIGITELQNGRGCKGPLWVI